VETIALFLSMPEKVGIYSALVLSTSSVLVLALYVRRKFARANGFLTALTEDWADAESRFFKIADVAEARISTLEPSAETVVSPSQSPSIAPPEDVNFDTRHQAASMGKRGMGVAEIAHTLGLAEAEVEVVLGMHRIAGGKK
jgi:hypothetical protein